MPRNTNQIDERFLSCKYSLLCLFKRSRVQILLESSHLFDLKSKSNNKLYGKKQAHIEWLAKLCAIEPTWADQAHHCETLFWVSLFYSVLF